MDYCHWIITISKVGVIKIIFTEDCIKVQDRFANKKWISLRNLPWRTMFFFTSNIRNGYIWWTVLFLMRKWHLEHSYNNMSRARGPRPTKNLQGQYRKEGPSFHLWEEPYLQSQDGTMALEVEKMKMTKLKTETSIQSKSYRNVQAKLLHKYFRVCCKWHP